MKSHAILLAALVLVACNRDGDEDQPASGNQRTAAADSAAPRKPVYPEPEAVAVLQAVADAEIAAARVARDVSLNLDVLRYAGVVIADQRAIRELLDSALRTTGQTPRDNAISTQIRATGDSIARALASLPSGFNNTFIEEQIRSNESTLRLLDTAVIPSASSQEVRSLIESIRPAIAAHLQRGRQILADRRKAAAERGENWESGLTRAPRPAAPAPAPAPVSAPAPEFVDTVPPPPTTTTFE